MFETIYKITKYLNKGFQFDEGLSIIKEPTYDYEFFKKLSEKVQYRIRILINFLIVLINIAIWYAIMFVILVIVMWILKKKEFKV